MELKWVIPSGSPRKKNGIADKTKRFYNEYKYQYLANHQAQRLQLCLNNPNPFVIAVAYGCRTGLEQYDLFAAYLLQCHYRDWTEMRQADD